MPFEIKFNNKTFVATFFGDTSIDVINDAHVKIFGSNEFDDCKNLIADFTKADLSSVSEADTIIPVAQNLGAATYKTHLNFFLVATEEHAVNLCKKFIESSRLHESRWGYYLCSTLSEAEQLIKT